MRWEIQCKALRRREKSRRRRNRGEQWKKQGAEQWKQAEIRARADASPGHIDTPHKESPAAERRRAHTSKTRISAIAHPSAERTLKSAPVGPVGLSKTPAIRTHMRWPCPTRRGRMNDTAAAADGLNFDLPDEIRMLKETVRKFVDRELIPIERESRIGHKLKPEVRAHLREKAQELGLTGYDVPRAYGGLGMGLVAKVTVWAELGRTIALPSR